MKTVLCCIVVFLLADSNVHNPASQEIVSPDSPVSEREAISDKVTNGHLFESGHLDWEAGNRLNVPSSTLVEEYDGDVPLVYLTKSMNCSGHPPANMGIRASSAYFGIASQSRDGELFLSTFGEWRNRGGSATIRLLIVVPRGTDVTLAENLGGPNSLASTEMDFGNKQLKECYWYAGIEPAKGWNRVSTHLHFNRFLSPEK